jgi:D-arabinose 1-dehydrogenase-like Zn-dependent alcohol dehydrogenase
MPKVDLSRVFLNQISIIGSALGTVGELGRVASLCAAAGISPVIDSTWPLSEARAGLARMLADDLFGKVVIDCSE